MHELKAKFSKFYDEYETYLPAAFFLLGFIFDLLTLGRIDDLGNIISQTFYFIVLYAGIYFELTEFKPIEGSKLGKVWKYKDEFFHFLLGALLSAFTIFYFKSSSLMNSFFFMFLMSFLLILNEIEFFQKFGIHIKASLLKLCQVSFFLYLIPLVTGKMGLGIFLTSCLISFILSYVFYFGFKKKFGPSQKLKDEFLKPNIVILSIFIILYFLKILPPLPLHIQSIGIYHKVEKQYPNYNLYQTTSKWKFWSNGDQDFEYLPKDKIYVFTRIFSPGGFKDKIYLHWKKKVDGDWKTSDRIPLKITGGRDKGYRGVAYKSNYTEGDWKILVETENGLEIGRINFQTTKLDSTEKREFHKTIDN